MLLFSIALSRMGHSMANLNVEIQLINVNQSINTKNIHLKNLSMVDGVISQKNFH